MDSLYTPAQGDTEAQREAVERLIDAHKDLNDSAGGRSQRMYALGYECGEEARTFLLCYAREPDYVDSFVRCCTEHISEEGSDEDAEATGFALGMWDDPRHERRGEEQDGRRTDDGQLRAGRGRRRVVAGLKPVSWLNIAACSRNMERNKDR